MEIMFDTSTDRGEVSGTELTDTANSSPVMTGRHKGGIFWLKAIVSTGDTVDVTIEGYDKIQGAWTALGTGVGGSGAYAFAQKTAASKDQLTIYPGLTASSNAVCSGILPNQFRAVGTVGGSSTPTVTYTLGVDLLD